MRKKDAKNKARSKTNRLIALNTLFVVFVLASAFTGTYAWFMSTRVLSLSIGSFSVVAPPDMDFSIFYLDHFEVDEEDKIGNWNDVVSEFSGYYDAYGSEIDEDVFFQQIEYDENGDPVPNASGKDPTDIRKLWPAHKLTYALVFSNEAPSSFKLKSWDEDVKEISPSEAIERGISVTSILKTETIESTSFYTITFSDGSTAEFSRTGEGDPIAIEDDSLLVTIESNKWVVNGIDTGISCEGDGGNCAPSVLSIEKKTDGDPLDEYEVTYSDLSTSIFTYDGEDVVSIPEHTPTVEILSNKWVVDGINTEIPVDGEIDEELSAPSFSLTITKTDSSTVDEVTTDTYRIKFSNNTYSTFTYNQSAISVSSSPSHSVRKVGDTWEVDGVDTGIGIEGNELESVEINLSWAIDIYGAAYSVPKTNEGDAIDIATGYKAHYLGETANDVFDFSQANPASSEDKDTPVEIVDSIPVNSSGNRTILYFTIEFSNDSNTFYSYDDGKNLFYKNVGGDSKCYEGLSLTKLCFSVS